MLYLLMVFIIYEGVVADLTAEQGEDNTAAILLGSLGIGIAAACVGQEVLTAAAALR